MDHRILRWVRRERPYSRTFWIVFSCFCASLLFFLFQGGKLAFMLFVALAILCLYLALGQWSGIASVRGSRNLGKEGQEQTIEAGSLLNVQVQVQIPGYWPIPYIFIRDKLVRRSGDSMVFESFVVPDWQRKGTIGYTTQPLRRGFYHFAATECSTEDIFGLFEHKGKLDLASSIRVLPRTVSIPNWSQLHLALKGSHSESRTALALRETTQINGIREYNYGDRLSRIHWNATARTGTLKSKEFERESLPKTVLVLDRQKKNYRNPDQFELAVSVAASLLEYALRRNLGLGLLSVGSDSSYFEPQMGAGGYKMILNHLVEVEADGFHSIQRTLEDRSRSFLPGTFMVVISPLSDSSLMNAFGWIKQRQMNPCHLWVGAKPEGEKEAWIRQLRGKGYSGGAVSSLEELPRVLGGRSI